MRVNEHGDLQVNFQNPHYRMNMKGGAYDYIKLATMIANKIQLV